MEIARQNKVDRLQTFLSESGEDYICFTSTDAQNWILHVSNGIEVWRLELDTASLESHRDLADVSSYEAYFSRFRHAFKTSDITLTNQSHKMNVMVGSGSTALRYELYEASANQRKKDLKNCLFWLSRTSKELQTRVTDLEEEVSTLKKQKPTAATAFVPEFEARKRPNTQSKAPKPQGLSIINPTSRKKKKATGVEFD